MSAWNPLTDSITRVLRGQWVTRESTTGSPIPPSPTFLSYPVEDQDQPDIESATLTWVQGQSQPTVTVRWMGYEEGHLGSGYYPFPLLNYQSRKPGWEVRYVLDPGE